MKKNHNPAARPIRTSTINQKRQWSALRVFGQKKCVLIWCTHTLVYTSSQLLLFVELRKNAKVEQSMVSLSKLQIYDSNQSVM